MIGAGYVFVLAVEAGQMVQCAIGAARSPIDRAIDLLDSRSRPAVLAYSRIGTLRRAARVRIDLRAVLNPWHSRGCWFEVPLTDGPQFRDAVRKTIDRYERGGMAIETHHIDMAAYFASRRRASLAVRRRFTASVGAIKYRAST